MAGAYPVDDLCYQAQCTHDCTFLCMRALHPDAAMERMLPHFKKLLVSCHLNVLVNQHLPTYVADDVTLNLHELRLCEMEVFTYVCYIV